MSTFELNVLRSVAGLRLAEVQRVACGNTMLRDNEVASKLLPGPKK